MHKTYECMNQILDIKFDVNHPSWRIGMRYKSMLPL